MDQEAFTDALKQVRVDYEAKLSEANRRQLTASSSSAANPSLDSYRKRSIEDASRIQELESKVQTYTQLLTHSREKADDLKRKVEKLSARRDDNRAAGPQHYSIADDDHPDLREFMEGGDDDGSGGTPPVDVAPPLDSYSPAAAAADAANLVTSIPDTASIPKSHPLSKLLESKLELPTFPTVAGLGRWKSNLYTAVKVAMGRNDTSAIKWIKEAEQSWADVDTMRHCAEEFSRLDQRLAEAIIKITPPGRFARRVEQVQFKENHQHDDILGGRQMLVLLYEHLATADDMSLVHAITDLVRIKFADFSDHNLAGFRDAFLTVAQSLPTDTPDSTICAILLEQLKESQVLKAEIARWRRHDENHREKTLHGLYAILDAQIRLEDADKNRERSLLEQINMNKTKGKGGPQGLAAEGKAKAAPKTAPKAGGKAMAAPDGKGSAPKHTDQPAGKAAPKAAAKPKPDAKSAPKKLDDDGKYKPSEVPAGQELCINYMLNKCNNGSDCTRYHFTKPDGKTNVCYFHNLVAGCDKTPSVCKYIHYCVGKHAKHLMPPARSKSPAGKGKKGSSSSDK